MTSRYRPSKAMLLAGVSAMAIAASTGATYAQDATAEDNNPFDTIVTVGKRPESVQTVPVAMSAFTAEFMERVNLDDVKDLIKFSPGFAGDSKDSFIDFVNIRGISTIDYGVGGDPSVGFFKNNLYQGRQGSAVSSMFDMQRAEVLRGPQGFLFGRNAISGAISFHTARPDTDNTNGYVEFGAGERGIVEAEGAVNLPMSDNFAIRVAGYTSHENGWMTNTLNDTTAAGEKYGGHDKTAGRFSATLEGETWDAFFVAEYEDRKTSGTVYRAQNDPTTEALIAFYGGDIMPDADLTTFKSRLGLGNFDRGKVVTISGEINIDLEFATFTSLTGFKDHDYAYGESYGGTSLWLGEYGQEQQGDYFEEEIRLVSSIDGPLSWYAGASFYKENINALFKSRMDEDVLCTYYYYDSYGYDNCSGLYEYWGYPFEPSAAGLNEDGRVIGSYTGWAAYVNLAYEVTDTFDVEVGVRYTRDTKDFAINVLPVDSDLGPWWNYGFTTDGPISQKREWDEFTPRFIARYQPNDYTMMYASITKGYKAGGFNSFGADLVAGAGVDDDGVALPGATPNSFGPEQVWSYELGLKGSTPEKTLKYDFSTYYYKYKGLQFTYFDRSTLTANVGEVTSYGIEGTVQAFLGDSVDIILSGSYNHNEIKDANLIAPGSDGNRLSGAPELKGAGIVSYHTPVSATGEITASAEFAAQSSVFVGLGNIVEGEMPGWTDVSLRLGYIDDAGWSITGYVENVFDKVYFDGGYEGGDILPTVFFGAARPRTFGAKVSYKFGGG